MVTSIEKALYYSATARRALRDAKKQKLHYRYSECIISAQESIEFLGKSVLEFMDIEYKREHYIGDELEKVGQRKLYLKEKVARAIVISDRWLQQSRNLTRYGFQSLGLSPKIAFLERDANYALSDAEEMLPLLDTVERSVKLQSS
jgi:HEPN domain-containing protein